MGQLRVCLPPFGPDYSGAAGLLFPFDSLLIIHDANGCTSNYTSYDEPRWYGSNKKVFCSTLRKLDIAIGDEERHIRRIVEAAKNINPKFIGIIGSPVPLVMGTDFEGLALEIEARTGITTLGLATNGTGWYGQGIALAGISLLDAFLTEKCSCEPRTFNLLGATPMDFQSEALLSLKNDLEKKDWKLIACLSDEKLPLDLDNMGKAQVNLALGEGGVEIAKWMERYFGIPYLACCPIGTIQTEQALYLMEKLSKKEISSGHCLWKHNTNFERKGLVLYEPIIARSMAMALEEDSRLSVDVVSPFPNSFAQETPDVRYLPKEEDLIRELAKPYDFVLADPLLLNLIKDPKKTKGIPLGHFAISSHFMMDYVWDERGNIFMNEILERIFKL